MWGVRTEKVAIEPPAASVVNCIGVHSAVLSTHTCLKPDANCPAGCPRQPCSAKYIQVADTWDDPITGHRCVPFCVGPPIIRHSGGHWCVLRHTVRLLQHLLVLEACAQGNTFPLLCFHLWAYIQAYNKLICLSPAAARQGCWGRGHPAVYPLQWQSAAIHRPYTGSSSIAACHDPRCSLTGYAKQIYVEPAHLSMRRSRCGPPRARPCLVAVRFSRCWALGDRTSLYRMALACAGTASSGTCSSSAGCPGSLVRLGTSFSSMQGTLSSPAALSGE